MTRLRNTTLIQYVRLVLMKRFCYRHPKFPRHGFVACLMLENEERTVLMHPLQVIYTSLASFQYDLKLLMKTNPSFETLIGESVLALPVTFLKLWPLKAEYWSSPEVPLTVQTRQHMFVEAVSNYTFFTLLATPLKYTKPYTMTTAVCPFMNTSTDTAIEKFMKTSSYPVPQSAAEAALYTFEEPYGIDWKTGKMIRQ